MDVYPIFSLDQLPERLRSPDFLVEQSPDV
jgi:hypothetical protein